MEAGSPWEGPRDALMLELSGLLNELHSHLDGCSTTIDLLDHLDGTRRAIDRAVAAITDKVEFFSPAVTRPLSTATDVSNISNSSSENSFASLDSHLTHLSSPTTLISEYDEDLNHRRRLLDEDEDILIGRSHLTEEDDEDEDGANRSGQEDSDERFERLSLLLTSVLKEANEAIRDYEAIHAAPLPEVPGEEEEEMASLSSRCASRLSTAASTVMGPDLAASLEKRPKSPLFSGPTSSLQEVIQAVMIQPPTAPPTPPPVDIDMSSKLFPLQHSDSFSSITSSVETLKPIPRITNADDEDIEEEDSIPLLDKETQQAEEDIPSSPTDMPKELSLDYLLGDYLNEVIMDVRRTEFVGARFWVFMMTVVWMWCFMWITSWGFSLGCRCNCKV